MKSEVYEELNAAIEAVEVALQNYRIPASVPIGPLGRGKLEYSRSENGYHLWWYPPDDPNRVLLSAAPLRIRTEAAHELQALLEALECADALAERKAIISTGLYTAFADRLGRAK